MHLRVALTSVAAMLFLLVSLIKAGPTSARDNGLLDVTCSPPSSDNAVYSPPLTLTPQMVAVNSSFQLGPCVSLSTPALTSGTAVAVIPPRLRNCLDLLDAGTSTRTISWNTGATSTLSMNRTTTTVGALLVNTYTGTVTSGLFAGDTVLMTVTSPATDITLCTLGLGTVPSVFGVVTLEITAV
ncbi:hypothetical protein KBY55_31015 [Streptomyces sp. b94]|uniref:hypothetical protein n=1 Tax=Streptomyces sp. b94 TaxID=1827634 RepID=UPI001B35F893|nr:hypothetical protein [Streptomyces sp. b94]MBQ1100378.1 hypothetical protein [Streptomyces sp. b94]